MPVVTWLAVLGAGCVDPGPSEVPSELLRASASSSSFVASVLEVTVANANADEQVWVEYDLEESYEADGELELLTPAQSGDLAVPVIGLKSGRTYRWRAVAIAPDGTERRTPIGTFEAPPVPSGLLGYELVRRRTDRSQLGYVLTSVVRPEEDLAWVGILDKDADWVWWVASPPGLVPLSARLGLDGRSVLWGEFDEDRSSSQLEQARVVRVSLDGQRRVETRLPQGHHDFIEHADGTLAYLSYVFVDGFEGSDLPLLSDQISVVQEGQSNPLVDVRFDIGEDYPYPPVPTCSHMQEERETFGTANRTWTQSNSLLYVDDEDAYYVHARFADWLVKVDRPSGAFVWQLNGPDGEFTPPLDNRPLWSAADNTLLWSHGHISQMWPGGMMVFDNGDHRTGASRVLEIAWREEQRQAWIAWEFAHPDGQFTPSMGDAIRLPGGNVLTTWAGLGDIIEVSGSAMVWRALATRGDILGRVTWLDDLYLPTPQARGVEPEPGPGPVWEPMALP